MPKSPRKKTTKINTIKRIKNGIRIRIRNIRKTGNNRTKNKKWEITMRPKKVENGIKKASRTNGRKNSMRRMANMRKTVVKVEKLIKNHRKIGKRRVNKLNITKMNGKKISK